jgi:serine phosphatase RsbU (regulator of sigma subunit)
MTVSVIKIDTNSRELTMSSAGHPLPLVVRPGSGSVKVQVLTAKAQSPLGFEFLTNSSAPAPYKDSHHKLESDDTILLFSDGLTEARDRANIQFQKKFVSTLKSLDRRYPPSILLDRIMQTLRGHTDGKQPDDDICLLVIDTRKDDGHEAVA